MVEYTDSIQKKDDPKTVLVNYLNNNFNKLEDMRELIIILIEALYSDDSIAGKKFLEKYRTDCRFKHYIRMAFSTLIGTGSIVVSNRLNKNCKTNIDNIVNILSVIGAASYSVGALRKYFQ